MPDRGYAVTPTVADAVPVSPVLVTPLNCEAVLGDHWRHVSEWARGHGVTIHRLGARPAIVVTELLAAIQRNGEAPAGDAEAPTGITEAEHIRRSLGVRRRTT